MKNPLKPAPSPERNQDVITHLAARVAEAQAAVDAAHETYGKAALDAAENGSPDAAKQPKVELDDCRNTLADAKAALTAAQARQAEAEATAAAKRRAAAIKEIRAKADALIDTGRKLYRAAPGFVAVHKAYIEAAYEFAASLDLVPGEIKHRQLSRLGRDFRETRVKMHLKTLGIESMFKPPLLGMFYKDFLAELNEDTREIADQACGQSADAIRPAEAIE
jgi:hypothetical protein